MHIFLFPLFAKRKMYLSTHHLFDKYILLVQYLNLEWVKLTLFVKNVHVSHKALLLVIGRRSSHQFLKGVGKVCYVLIAYLFRNLIDLDLHIL